MKRPTSQPRLAFRRAHRELFADLRNDLDDASAIVAYSSTLDGYGTSESDLDVYVVIDERNGRPERSTKKWAAHVDLEWWGITRLREFSEMASSRTARVDDLKVLYRLRKGVAVKPLPVGVIKLASLSTIVRALDRGWILLSARDHQNALGLQEMGSAEAALLAAQRSLVHALLAWCARQGRAVFKEKWLWSTLQHIGTPAQEFSAKYWTFATRVGIEDVDDVLRTAAHARLA